MSRPRRDVVAHIVRSLSIARLENGPMGAIPDLNRELTVEEPERRPGHNHTIVRRYQLSPTTVRSAVESVRRADRWAREPTRAVNRIVEVPSIDAQIVTYGFEKRRFRADRGTSVPAATSEEAANTLAAMITSLSPKNLEVLQVQPPVIGHVAPRAVPLHLIPIGIEKYQIWPDGRAATLTGGVAWGTEREPHVCSGQFAVQGDYGYTTPVIAEEAIHVMLNAFTIEQHRRLEDHFDELAEGQAPEPKDYRSENIAEYFAGCGMEFFNIPRNWPGDATALAERDRPMFDLLSEVFSGWDPNQDWASGSQKLAAEGQRQYQAQLQ